MNDDPIVEMRSVVKNYNALRPLRVVELSIAAGGRVAVAGIDAPGAEVMLNLVTGASLPDQGEVRVFGRSTSAVSDGDEWLASLDQFGIVSERAVLLEGATLMQNLALPFALEIDPVPPDTIVRVEALADECEIARHHLAQRAGDVPAPIRTRVHLARAIALNPRLLLMEHPTATLEESARTPFGGVVARVCDRRTLTMLAVTQDLQFAAAAAHETLTLHAATGRLVAAKRSWWRRSGNN
jgi:ABC-type transporter Mla maintaining outer membrane lipid asymmetry ATPase subunit MlaF